MKFIEFKSKINVYRTPHFDASEVILDKNKLKEYNSNIPDPENFHQNIEGINLSIFHELIKTTDGKTAGLGDEVFKFLLKEDKLEVLHESYLIYLENSNELEFILRLGVVDAELTDEVFNSVRATVDSVIQDIFEEGFNFLTTPEHEYFTIHDYEFDQAFSIIDKSDPE